MFYKITSGIAVAILLLCAIVVTMDEHRVSAQLTVTLKDVSKIEKSSADMLEATYATEGTIANLADTLNDISVNLKNHEEAQLKQAQDASEKLGTLFADADEAVKGVRQTVESSNEAVVQTGKDVHEMLQAGTADLNNPALKDIVVKADESAQNTSKATGEAAATMVSIHRGVDYEVALITKPAGKIKTGILILASAMGNFLHGFL